MRNFYILLSILFILAVLIFLSSFIYLDKEKHNTYYYTVSLDDQPIGTIEVDKYVTEDKRIYKSSSSIPFYSTLNDSKARLALDRKYNLESYAEETSGNGASETFTLENIKNSVSLVATFQSEFIALKDLPVRSGTFFLDEESPLTYLPIIEKYDFRRGRSQGFLALAHFAINLPPLKKVITLTSIRDEYVKVDSRYIKSECLLFKAQSLPQAIVWVAKSDRSLIKVEIPIKKLTITRTFSPKTFEVKEAILVDKPYLEKEVAFKSAAAQLAGTMTIPAKEGKLPAVLLIGGSAPYDRNYEGLFSSLADRLARDGFCVLRFDKRGIGSSKGDFNSTTDSDAVEDGEAALDCLLSQNEVDPARVVIIGHADGAAYAAKLAAKKDGIAALAMMAPLAPGIELAMGRENLPDIASRFGWGEEYVKLIMTAKEESAQYVNNTTSNSTSILATRCFLNKMRGRLAERGLDTMKAVRVPVLILQGNDDNIASPKYAATINGAIEEGLNKNHKLVYFDQLGHLFGTRTSDGIHRVRYEIDKAVSDMIKNWTAQTFAEIEAQAKAASAKAQEAIPAQAMTGP